MKNTLLFIGLIVLFSQKMFGQNTSLKTQSLKIGYTIGLGIPVAYELGVNAVTREQQKHYKYEYWVLSNQLELQKLWHLNNQHLYLGYLINTQVNLGDFRSNSKERGYNKTMEFGANANVVFGYNFYKSNSNKYLLTYAFLGSGPHYLSDSPKRQSDGFIFSDNLGIGTQIGINNVFLIDLRLGIRHLSNASIKRPNAGINNLFFNIGLKNML